ncbi:MAG: hypothetical protein R2706_18800 [Acidimicrobiales bacterium]
MLTLLAGALRAGYSLPQGMDAVSHEIADPMGYGSASDDRAPAQT